MSEVENIWSILEKQNIFRVKGWILNFLEYFGDGYLSLLWGHFHFIRLAFEHFVKSTEESWYGPPPTLYCHCKDFENTWTTYTAYDHYMNGIGIKVIVDCGLRDQSAVGRISGTS